MHPAFIVCSADRVLVFGNRSTEVGLRPYVGVTTTEGSAPDVNVGAHPHGAEKPISNDRLGQNFPNPFSTATTITYTLPHAATVTLTIRDVLGRRVSVVTSGARVAGRHEEIFPTTRLSSGIYFYHLEAGDFVETTWKVVVK